MTSTPEPFARADAPRLVTPSGPRSNAAPSGSNQGTAATPSRTQHPQSTWRATTMNEELPESTHANIIALEVLVKSLWAYVLWWTCPALVDSVLLGRAPRELSEIARFGTGR